MRYRIQYQDGPRRQSTIVEANSPNEAMVKFQNVRQSPDWRCNPRFRVTSVTAAESGDDRGW